MREAAASTNMPMCVDRWLGGTLTKYKTVKKSIAKFKKYQAMETSGELSKLPRKEESAIKREMTRMQKNFSGIADMGEIADHADLDAAVIHAVGLVAVVDRRPPLQQRLRR